MTETKRERERETKTERVTETQREAEKETQREITGVEKEREKNKTFSPSLQTATVHQ